MDYGHDFAANKFRAKQENVFVLGVDWYETDFANYVELNRAEDGNSFWGVCVAVDDYGGVWEAFLANHLYINEELIFALNTIEGLCELFFQVFKHYKLKENC